ncbi:MAG: hypothetical protein Q7R34_00355, partial [Dehalococcoidia bacterium]|nr:hypothetical protein [Dehalococcoidia bacterium]
GLAFSAHGFTLLDKKLSISGYVQNQSSYRVGGDSDQWVSSENRLQLEMEAKLHPNVTLSGVFRGTYDAIYDLRSDSDQWSRDYEGSRDNLSTEYKMRELVMDATLGKWNFRIGKQQVVWGEADGLRLMDIINPLDMRRQFVTRNWEDIRIPQTMVKAVYGIDPMRNSFLELLWNPGNIKRDKAYADTTMSNDHKSPWTLSNPPLLEKMQIDDLTPLVPMLGGAPGTNLQLLAQATDLTNPSALNTPFLRKQGILEIAEDDTPSWINVNKSEFGGRLGGEAGGWFLTLNYWQGFSKSPVMKYEGGGVAGADALVGLPPLGPPGTPGVLETYASNGLVQVAPGVFVPIGALLPGYQGPYNAIAGAYPIRLRLDYPRERVIGFTFNKAAGMWVWRGEFATYVDKHYNKLGPGDDWSPSAWVLNNAMLQGDMIAERTLQASMLGFDYKRLITWLNPEKMFFISGQVFNHHIFGYDEELRFGPYMQKPREDSFALSLLVNTEYHMGRICPEVLVVYDAAATGWYIKPRVEFKYGDHWRPEIGALVFTGDQYELPFGELNNNDEIYFRLKYQF